PVVRPEVAAVVVPNREIGLRMQRAADRAANRNAARQAAVFSNPIARCLASYPRYVGAEAPAARSVVRGLAANGGVLGSQEQAVPRRYGPRGGGAHHSQ